MQFNGLLYKELCKVMHENNLIQDFKGLWDTLAKIFFSAVSHPTSIQKPWGGPEARNLGESLPSQD